MSLFLDTIKQDYMTGEMKIITVDHVKKMRLNNKKMVVKTYYMEWKDGRKTRISHNNLDAFLEEIKSDIINKQL